MRQTIVDAFNQYFEMVPTHTEELKEESYKLRFQVYCNETHFEDPALHPDGLEYDEFDNSSTHYLIRHRNSNIYAATTRLIKPDPLNPNRLFPIEIHSTISNTEILKDIPRQNIAEVSRFCVSKEFKRRKKEIGYVTGINKYTLKYITEDEHRIFPHLTVALIACLIRISKEQNIQYWFAVMEPALLRFLSTMGINFVNIGPFTEYHGKRKPSLIKVSDLLNGVLLKKPSLWQLLTNNGQFIPSEETTNLA